ncbi:MAG: M20/M25/M40 family metallo-hydrolase [Bacteroidetes bacterium]|nr:M20/M25/M40 family metallo-hydrolase [Bacteroidota bacterium]
MKRFILALLSIVIFQTVFADKLVMIHYQDAKTLKNYFSNNDVRIHYVSDNFIIATVDDDYPGSHKLIQQDSWNKNDTYYLSWFHKGIESEYLNQISQVADIYLQTEDFLIISPKANAKLHPPINGRLTRIVNKEISQAGSFLKSGEGIVKFDPDIEAIIEEVDTNIYLTNLQHLQDYGTRNAYSPEAIEAQNWLKDQFESYGYAVELFDFSMPNGQASDNVIATKTGTKYPDEYVIIGGHYDSYSYSGQAPGADDDASGVCGVLEVARVMADFETDRTVLFCAWSGEEYGLYGSEAYADWAASQDMNILGYFNIDMCGYRNPGDPIHTDMIAPSSAQPLVQFYTEVCALYLPDFIIDAGNLTGGDSDHTSFNNAGYMGIFPFEDSQNYSPYIHTSNDVIGTSVNSLEMAMMFTQAMVANVATMANYLAPPANLVAFAGNESVELVWEPLEDIDHYNVYKNNEPTAIAATTEPTYLDEDVVNFETYTYYVTGVYPDGGEETDPSNMATITPLPPMAFPFQDDFETGALYWNFEGTWGLTTSQSYSSSHAITESPNGNYQNNLEISAGLYSFSLENAISAELHFMTKYNLETNYDYTWLEISTDGNSWTELDEFNGVQNSWSEKTYSLNDYLEEPHVFIRFRFYSDVYVTEDGMYIDDLMLNVENIGTTGMDDNRIDDKVMIYPNPMKGSANIDFTLEKETDIEMNILDAMGKNVQTIESQNMTAGHHSVGFTSELSEGIYFIVIKFNGIPCVKKMVITKK